MGKYYEQLTLEERCLLSRLHEDGKSVREIASTMDRAPSTVARELRRNGRRTKVYEPSYAQAQAASRRWKGSRLERQPDLRQAVLDRLAMGWSPQQIAGRLAQEEGAIRISHESIYRFIYAQIRRTKDYQWRHYLFYAKSKRGYRSRKRTSSVHFIQQRLSIHERPPEVLNRQEVGHWEGDLMLFGKPGAILALQERASRFIMLANQPHKTADPIAKKLIHWLHPLPQPLRKTITFDNGTEFAAHHQLHALGIKTYFCDTHSPWQKGGIENAIGRLRRVLPRKTDLATMTHKRMIELIQLYNHTPRKCLNFKTPAEVFASQLLHFKCESTSPPARG